MSSCNAIDPEAAAAVGDAVIAAADDDVVADAAVGAAAAVAAAAAAAGDAIGSETRYQIRLLHKYETHLWSGDYSRGTFFEGSVTVCGGLKDVDVVVDRFKTLGVIELYEATNKYESDCKIADDRLTRLEFLNADVSKNVRGAKFSRQMHQFGDGFVCVNERGYTYMYWLHVVELKANETVYSAAADAADPFSEYQPRQCAVQ
jgi:hypothetical protein